MRSDHTITKDETKSTNWAILPILVYIGCLLVQPQSRFPFLGAIQFEKIVVGIAFISLFATGNATIRASRITFLMLAFYLIMLLGYSLSPYQDFAMARDWLTNYWKCLVLYFLVLFGVKSLRDISLLFTGIVAILCIYQILSWNDFLNGGSYVYQQGMKRIVGIWSGGIGAANYFGMISLYSLPLAVFWFKKTERRGMKAFLLCYLLMSFLSILYSGTRGAMMCFIIFFLLCIGTLGKKKVGIGLAVMIWVLSTVALPDYLSHRYFETLPFFSEEGSVFESESDRMAKNSAFARLKGMVEGFQLARKRPIVGYGPGASAIARDELYTIKRRNPDGYFQLHNLYGQVLAETGFVGGAIFLCIIAAYFLELRGLAESFGKSADLNLYKWTLQMSLIVFLLYGFASHTLYRYHWALFFACQGAFVDIVLKGRQAEINKAVSQDRNNG
jgi:O-antigen ligase